jgi:hypothetical protein
LTFLEEYARWLLVLHAVVGAALVATTTHLVVWMRGYLRGKTARQRAVRRFSVIAVVLFAITFVLGNLAYPTYKVHVRAGYLEDAAAIEADLANRAPRAPGAIDEALAETNRIVRWFDVKEHWAAIGLVLSIACAVILRAWDPARHGRDIALIAFGLALGAAATAWLAALVGLVTSSYRSIGGLG